MVSFGQFCLLTRKKSNVLRFGYSYIARFCSSQAPPRVGIVGSGPAGFYTAQHILKVTFFIFFKNYYNQN